MSRDLSGETIGICFAGKACKVSLRRLVGGLGRSALTSDLGSVVVTSFLGLTFTFTATDQTQKCAFRKHKAVEEKFSAVAPVKVHLKAGKETNLLVDIQLPPWAHFPPCSLPPGLPVCWTLLPGH